MENIVEIIRLSTGDAKYLADAMLAVSKTSDLYTPAIAGAQLTVLPDGRVRALATDRYRVHHVEMPQSFDTEKTTEFEEFELFLPNEALTWLSQHTRFAGKEFYSYVTIERLPEPFSEVSTFEHLSLRVVRRDGEWVEAVLRGRQIGDNEMRVPPIWRLFEVAEKAEDYTGPIRIRLDYLSAVSKLGRTKTGADIRYTASTMPGKIGPALVTFPTYSKERVARALVQPEMVIS